MFLPIQTAIEQANKSDYHYRIGAVIFDKKRILSTGYNKAHSTKKKLHPKFRKWETSIHAEAMAILNAKCDLKGKSILIVRMNAGNNLNAITPCEHCMSYLQYVGIKNVYYSDENGNIQLMKI